MNAIKTFTVGLTRYWWVPLVSGLICLGLGIWCFVNPVNSIEFLAYLFCACMIVAGVLDISFGLFNRSANLNWGWSLALGILEIFLGGWLIALPAGTLAVAFIYAVGIWIIVVAINSLCEAAAMSSVLGGAVIWMVLALVATIILACIFIFNPLAGGIAVWLYLGLSLVFFGCYRIGLAFSLRSLNKQI